LIPRHYFVEGIALPLSDCFSRSKFWSLSNGMFKSERTPRETLKLVQHERLHRLLTVASKETHFWNQRISLPSKTTCSLELLKQLPPVSKSELEAGFPDQVVNRSSNQKDLRFAATRGTTQRMICVHDFDKRESIRAAMVRTLRSSGYRLGMPMVEIPPDICDTVCGEQGERDIGVLAHITQMAREHRLLESTALRDLRGLIERNWIYHRRTYPLFGKHGSNPPASFLDEYIVRLQRDRPYVLKGLTTYLYQIAKRILSSSDVRLKVPIIKPLGSGVTPTMRQTIEKAFQGKLHDDYGSAELGSIACECDCHDGMHVFSDLFIIEVVDNDGMNLPNGEVGEVVVTDLVNHAMPLIRYRIGDLGKIDDTPCRCGRSSPRLSIVGRVQDSLVNHVGQSVSSFEIAEKLYGELAADEFQLNEKSPTLLELTLVPRQNTQLDSTQVEESLLDLLGHHRKLQVRTARTISPEPGGKFRWVKTIPTTIKK